MSNRILEQINPDGSVTEWIEIKGENDSITVMLKSIYDAQQAEQSTLLINAVGIDKVE